MKRDILITAVVLIGIILVFSFYGSDSHENHPHGMEEVRGTHGGRLLGSTDFQAEVTIYEPNIPPQSRVYFYENGKMIDPEKVDLSMELHRLDRVDVFNYKKQGEYLIGDRVVEEPHSFDVKIQAKYQGEVYKWEYPSYEGRTEISPEAVKEAGIEIGVAKSTKLRQTIRLNGKIVANQNALLHVTPRFSSVVKELKKDLGDTVEKDEVIALMEGNDSLSEYQIKSKIAGTIIERNVSAGEVLAEGESLYVVADLRTVWVDFSVSRKDLSRLEQGQMVVIQSPTLNASENKGKIIYISDTADQDTQMFLVRAELENSQMNWSPGLYVAGDVIVEEEEVPVAVEASALQKFRDWDVVFKKKGNLFEIAILELGRSDMEWVEVLSGLKPNTEYVTKNSFVLKADILKSGAAHDH